MKLAALKTYWPFSTRADGDVSERLPSVPQIMTSSDVSDPCPEERPETTSVHTVLEARLKPCPSTVAATRGRQPCSDASTSNPSPNDPCVSPQRVKTGKTPRRKRYKVERLYGVQKPTTAEIHAARLLLDIADGCPHIVGTWITMAELSQWYAELATREGWEAQGWIPVARALTTWTARKRPKKRTSYLIPRPTAALRRRAALAGFRSQQSVEAA